MPQYIYAYDPLIRKRVVYVIRGEIAISMVTGYQFKYKPEVEKFGTNK